MAWLLFLQLVTYGCGMPVYAWIHLSRGFSARSATDESRRQAESKSIEKLRDLPISIIIGYGLPTVLMALPLKNNLLHQWFGGFWQGHPIWVVLVQMSLSVLRTQLNLISTRRNESMAPPQLSVDGRYLNKIRNEAYLFAFGTATTTHIASFAIIGLRTLFPLLFSKPTRDAMTLRNTFQPPAFWTNTPMEGAAIAVLTFFQYDLYSGSVTSIFWALTLYLRSRRKQLNLNQGLSLVFNMVGSCLVAGPSGVLIVLMWLRDKEVGRADKNEVGKKT